MPVVCYVWLCLDLCAKPGSLCFAVRLYNKISFIANDCFTFYYAISCIITFV